MASVVNINDVLEGPDLHGAPQWLKEDVGSLQKARAPGPRCYGQGLEDCDGGQNGE